MSVGVGLRRAISAWLGFGCAWFDALVFELFFAG